MLIVALALFTTACAAADTAGSDQTSGDEPTTTTTEAPNTPQAAQTVLPTGASALTDPFNDAFPDPLIPLSEITVVLAPDSIRSIDNPVFLQVADNLEILDPAEPVVALEINGDARAYPVRVMVSHEIVNDVVGGVPIAITYCPLCNSAVTYIREINGVETTFGISGLLFASALIMYDRATESLWTHFDGRAVVGVLAGAQLESIPSPLLAWGDFRENHPTGQVLDWNATGFDRDYGRNPYVGYDDPDTNPFLFFGTVDDRARAKQRVVGVAIDGEAAAFSLDYISGGEAKATNEAVSDKPVVIFWKAGQSSALDTQDQFTGKDVGSVGVFDPVVDGELLTFVAVGDRFVDEATSSTWTITGEAVDGPLAGTVLERLDHLDTFWFAWSTYRPETVLVES